MTVQLASRGCSVLVTEMYANRGGFGDENVAISLWVAARWYAGRDREVGWRFVAAVDRAVRRTAEWPDAGSLSRA